MLVGSLALRWGHYSAPDRGKIVWCELAIAPVEVSRPPGAAGAPAAGSGPRGRPAAAASAGAGVSAAASAGVLPRRGRRHPVGARTDGPDEATLLRVLEGLRALDVSDPDRRRA
ncbi:hypothetical protein GCM10027612_49700 [Microbispora bryophytorum subsp. camponoti]